jgi:hypothetical protein
VTKKIDQFLIQEYNLQRIFEKIDQLPIKIGKRVAVTDAVIVVGKKHGFELHVGLDEHVCEFHGVLEVHVICGVSKKREEGRGRGGKKEEEERRRGEGEKGRGENNLWDTITSSVH